MWRPKSARNASEPVSWGPVVPRAEGRRALYHSHRESAATRSAPGQREISWAGFRPSRRRRGSMPARTHPDIAGRGARVRPLRYASRVEPSYPPGVEVRAALLPGSGRWNPNHVEPFGHPSPDRWWPVAGRQHRLQVGGAARLISQLLANRRGDTLDIDVR